MLRNLSLGFQRGQRPQPLAALHYRRVVTVAAIHQTSRLLLQRLVVRAGSSALDRRSCWGGSRACPCSPRPFHRPCVVLVSAVREQDRLLSQHLVIGLVFGALVRRRCLGVQDAHALAAHLADLDHPRLMAVADVGEPTRLLFLAHQSGPKPVGIARRARCAVDRRIVGGDIRWTRMSAGMVDVEAGTGVDNAIAGVGASCEVAPALKPPFLPPVRTSAKSLRHASATRRPAISCLSREKRFYYKNFCR